jgi:hypothetical protein
MLTAICNIYLNSEIKYKLFAETFLRVYPVSDNWLIYIRGKFKDQAYKYIQDTCPLANKNCTFFYDLIDNHWPKSVLIMLEKARYKTVYVYLEDHFLMRTVADFHDVIRDMERNQIDFFKYTFFNLEIGRHNIEKLYPENTRYFYTFEYTQESAPLLKKEYSTFCAYPTSIIVNIEYFRRYMESLSGKLIRIPFLIQAVMENFFFIYPRNRLFWARVNRITKRWKVVFGLFPTGSTYVGERMVWEANEDFLPLKVGILKEELFANWDDDNGNPHSCLIKRGLYPLRLQVEADSGLTTPPAASLRTYTITEGEEIEGLYYPDAHRVVALPVKYIRVESGCLVVKGGNESITLRGGEETYIYSNIPHRLIGKKASRYSLWIGAQSLD